MVANLAIDTDLLGAGAQIGTTDGGRVNQALTIDLNFSR